MHTAASYYGITGPGACLRTEPRFTNAASRAGNGAGQTGRAWRPAADVYDDGTTILVEIDLPGLSREEISVQLDGSVLTVSGERKVASAAIHAERGLGRFLRSFAVPAAVQADQVRAAYRRGVLQITLPRSGSVPPVHVKVETIARG